MKISIPLAVGALALLLADDILGQRGRFRGRFRGRPEVPQPEPKAEPEKKKEVESWLAIKGADVYLGTGQLMRRATVVIGDDKIHKIEHDPEIPEGATVIDATGKVVAPGFVAVKASGMGVPRSNKEKIVDSLNPFDPSIKMGLAAGITSFLATFESGTNKPGGKTAVVKLAYGDLDGMVVTEDSVYSMRVPTTASQWRDLRDLVKKAKDYLEEKKKDDAAEEKKPAATEAGSGKAKPGGGKKPDGPPKGTEQLLEVLRGDAVLWVTATRSYDNPAIHGALDVADLLGKGVVLDNPITAWSLAEEIAETGSMAIINPRARNEPDPARPEVTGSNIASAAILSGVGVPLAVVPPGGRFGGAGLGTGGILGQDLHTLHLDAAYAVRGGMDNRKALRTITLDAARIIGADSRIGSLEAGKDADLLILDGDPLHYRTFVQTAIVNGKVVYEKDKEPFYRHIKR